MGPQLHFKLAFVLGILALTTYAQDNPSPILNVGDPAPPLQVSEWIKGSPVPNFEKGKTYVVEFWATWCAPCKAAMPHLSDLARKYKDRVTVLSVDVMESKTTTISKVKAFVEGMGQRMDYNVAVDDSNFMVNTWIEASGRQGIPWAVVVNAEGRLAWYGHPKDLDNVLPQIVNNTWDVKKELAKQRLNKQWAKLDEAASYQLYVYLGDARNPEDLGKPDSALIVIDELVKKEPRLKFAPRVAYNTFTSLLKTNPLKAYDYGMLMMTTSTYEDPAYELIAGAINLYSEKINLPPLIYRLGAEAYQADIDHMVYPELVHMTKLYSNMAEMYWRANERPKAVGAAQKAIQALKLEQATKMKALESRLEKYGSK